MSGSGDPPPAVEVQDLVVRYDTTTAVRQVTFRAAPGEVVALLGPNGAGKTSTMEVLAGFRAPDEGSARVLGLDPVLDHHRVVGQVGVMPQEGGLSPAMRPEEAAHLYAAYYPRPLDPDTLLTRLGLADVRGRTIRSLSGGERQRLSLALALIGRPSVLLLDEPTAGVDVHGRRLIREVLAEQARESVCVLVATHELDEAERIADRVVVVDRGRVVADGSPADLVAGTDAITFRGPTDLDVGGLEEALGVAVEVGQPGRYRIAGEADPAVLATLTAWLAEGAVAVEDLRTGPTSLEEAFVRLTGHEPDPVPPAPTTTGRRTSRRRRAGG